MNLTVSDPGFETSYCLPEGFCNKTVEYKGKNMKWVCKDGKLKYYYSAMAAIITLVSLAM